MRKIMFLLILIFTFSTTLIVAQKIPEGKYNQVGQSWGPNNDCFDCSVTILEKQPDIIEIEGKHGDGNTIGFAWYDKKDKIYYGKMQWGDLDPFDSEVYFKNGTLTIVFHLEQVGWSSSLEGYYEPID